MKCPRCGEQLGDGSTEHEYADFVCASCEDEIDDDSCIRDDSTECDCSRCTGAEDRFWQEQGEQKPGESVESEPDLKCCPRFTWGDGTHDLGCRGATP